MAMDRRELEALLALLQLAVGRKRQVGLAPLLNLIKSAIGGRNVTLPSSLQRLLRDAIGQTGESGSSHGRPPRQPENPARPFVPPQSGTPRGHPPGNVVRTPELPPNQRRTRAPQGFPEEQPDFSDEFFAPSSSNVYSFQFFRRAGQRLGILYVTFRASSLNSAGLVGGPGRLGGRKQLHGIPGRVHGKGKLNEPGPTYAYYDVPPALFTRMKGSYSKGKFVWDELRVRGTVYGHKFKYGLVVGQLVEGVPGFPGAQYIPRKATRRGFVTRSVADIGTGRRGFTTSTLPPSYHGEGGFSTRRR